jgi:hypothetical protein
MTKKGHNAAETETIGDFAVAGKPELEGDAVA